MEQVTPEEFNRDITNYIRINNKIYRRFWHDPNKLNPEPITESTMKKVWNITARDIEDNILTLDGWTVEPGHFENWSQIHVNMWNEYEPLGFNPREGEWPTIHKLINHLYGDNGVEKDQTELLYDYHTLLLKEPKRKLFGRVLYSLRQGTSKSALAVLESYMFGGNYTKVRDTELEEKFNSVWAHKLIIHMDEPYFEKKKKMSRFIRDMITMERTNLRKMNSDFVIVPFHGKVLITTNDTDFMPIESGDRRYWIREIPPFPKEDMDPNFNEKMKREVEHYIHFLLNREMSTQEKDSTFYLPQKTLNTVGFSKLVGDNLDDDELQLRDWFENYFLKDKKRSHVTFNLKDLARLVEWEGKTPSTKRIAVLLRDGLKLKQPDAPRRLKKGENYIDKSSDAIYGAGRFWTAKRTHFNLQVDVFGKTGY